MNDQALGHLLTRCRVTACQPPKLSPSSTVAVQRRQLTPASLATGNSSWVRATPLLAEANEYSTA
jgi:hypothetical protein